MITVSNRHDTNALTPTLPVLDRLRAEFGTIRPDTAGLFGLQHLFGSTATLVRRLAEPSLSPRDVFLLGKPYSTHPGVADALRNQYGFWVHPDSTDQSRRDDNDALMDDRIGAVLERIADRFRSGRYGRNRRFLLIDDGARAIRQLHEPRFDDVRHRFTCVEQTRCGTRHIADLDLETPVINVAESRAKLVYESPLIAESVVLELQKKLRGLRAAGIAVDRRALVSGYGAIGAAVADALRDAGFAVAVHDVDSTRLHGAARRGYTVCRDYGAGLRRGGLIVGCTGLPVMERRHHAEIADGALLISASSSDVEFRSWQLRARGECLGDPARWTADGRCERTPDADGRRWDHPCFSLYRIRDAWRTFHLVNGGFPVNFSGGVDPIAPEKIQLTRSLLYLGALQATRTTAPGLHALDDRFQQRLLSEYATSVDTLAA